MGQLGEPRLVALLLAIVRLYESSGPPSFDALAHETGLSKSSVHFGVHCLQQRGFVDFEDGKHKTLHPLVREVPR